MFKKEVCVENFDGALRAYQQGADFIELCDNLAVGGTSPAFGVLKKSLELIPCPMTVLIRPRGGNFIYTGEEIDIVTQDILCCKQIGYQSIRVGALTPDLRLDERSLKLWKEVAYPMDISCHMAFDEIPNYEEGLDLLVSLGYDAILTKGGSTKVAPQNQQVLYSLVEYAQNRITIIPGSGITADNVQEIACNTKANRLHGTKILRS
ncbi:MAG: copper homeostasis protein CutC [Brevinema sp.]